MVPYDFGSAERIELQTVANRLVYHMTPYRNRVISIYVSKDFYRIFWGSRVRTPAASNDFFEPKMSRGLVFEHAQHDRNIYEFYNCNHNFTIVITIVKFLQICDFCHFLMFSGVIDDADHDGAIFKFVIVTTIVLQL